MELVKEYRSVGQVGFDLNEDEDLFTLGINPTPEVDTTRVANLNEISLGHIQPENSALVKRKELPTGKVEVHAMNLAVFREQFYNYRRFGTYADPSNIYLKVGWMKRLSNPEQTIVPQEDQLAVTAKILSPDQVLAQKLSVYASSSPGERELSKAIKAKRVKGGDSGTGEYLGPWACYEGETEFDRVNQTAEDRKAVLQQAEASRKAQLEAKKKEEEFQATSEFHGDAMHDYKGRSYILPPQDRSYARAEQNYIPKTTILNQ